MPKTAISGILLVTKINVGHFPREFGQKNGVEIGDMSCASNVS